MASAQDEPAPPSAASSESESRQNAVASAAAGQVPGSAAGTRKRASRAGTRSVSTLSAAQLERKRANDREAQRAIRARTKDHIEKLERKIQELSNLDGRNEQLLAALKRNKELEEENQMLRATLDQQNYALSGGVPESPASGWQNVPHLKTPIQGQPPLRLSTQQEMRSSVGSPSSAVPRTDSAGFAQPSQWQSQSSNFGSPMSSRGFGAPLRSADSQQDPNQQWRYPQRRSQTTPIQEDYKTVPQAQMNQQMDYSYMQGSSESQAASRNNSQPSIFQNNPQAHDQHMRHLSEQLGLSPVEMGGYGQLQSQQQGQTATSQRPIPSMTQNQQQQSLPQHQHQQHNQQSQQQAPPISQHPKYQQQQQQHHHHHHNQQQPQLPSQSPSQYQPQPPGRSKPAPADNTAHDQQFLYGPYSSR